MNSETVSALQEFAASRSGKIIMQFMQDEFDKGVANLLYCKPDEVEVQRGRLRQLYEFMSGLSKVNRVGNTHGAS